MKKLVSLILTLAMVLSMGLCTAQADEPTKIIWWVYGSEAPIDTQIVVDAANAYSAEKIGVVVELLFLDEEGFNCHEIQDLTGFLQPFRSNLQKQRHTG